MWAILEIKGCTLAKYQRLRHTMTISDRELLAFCLIMQGCSSTNSNPYSTIFIHFHAKKKLCSKLRDVAYCYITTTKTIIADLSKTLTLKLCAVFC